MINKILKKSKQIKDTFLLRIEYSSERKIFEAYLFDSDGKYYTPYTEFCGKGKTIDESLSNLYDELNENKRNTKSDK